LSFQDFKLSPAIISGLSDMGFTKATPIQLEAIPAVLNGKDILASAQTGTGKTAAFAIPLLEKLSSEPKQGIRALILAPTRELAVQIDEHFWSIGYHAGVSSASVYGGTDWGAQEKAIREGVNVIVATPGRLLDHIKVSNIDFSKLEFLVLDEADRMLDMGFLPDVRTIIGRLPKQRQTLLFSATFSDKIENLTRELTKNPVRINISSFKPAEGVVQKAYKVPEEAKVELVLDLFDNDEVLTAIVFTSTKRGADSLARALSKKKVKVSSIHGDREQREREETLADFKSGKINVIVATDVMARGIDVTGVSHVINYNVPRDIDDYIHRIGRTARAEMKGTAITLVSPLDSRYFSVIKNEMRDKLEICPLPTALSRYESSTADVPPAKKPHPVKATKPVKRSVHPTPHSKIKATRNKPESDSQDQRKDIRRNEETNDRSPKVDNRRTPGDSNRRTASGGPPPRPRQQQSNDKRNNDKKSIEELRNQRINNVSNPLKEINNQSSNGAEEKKSGLISKILSVFGSKK
jgi:ATP-dependent RNA helicase RhlE